MPKLPQHRRIRSSFTEKRNDKLSVVIDSKIVAKKEIYVFKQKFEELSHEGLCRVRDIYSTVIALGYRIQDTIDPESLKEVGFYDLLQLMFPKATSGQLARLMGFAGERIEEKKPATEFPPVPEKKTLDPRALATYKKMFEKYDKNHDGVIDLKELKQALKESLTDETIENLYYAYHEKMNGLSLKKFIRLYAPADVEIV